MDKTLQELNLDDDFLFAKVMTDKEICRKVMEKILGIDIDKIELPIGQNTIDILLGSKGIRLDIYVKDSKGTVFNCEMQRGKKKELPRRSRYYQGNIDLDMIAKGVPYRELKPSYVIFICTFDPFDRGFHYYTFKETCAEDSTLLLGDETTKVFLNTKGKLDDIDDTLKEFLGYVEHSTDTYVKTVKSELVKMLHNKVIAVKESKEMEVEYMTLLERDREMKEEGREEGREEGEIITTVKIMRKILEKGQTPDVIAEALGLNESEVETIINFIVNNEGLSDSELAKIIQGEQASI